MKTFILYTILFFTMLNCKPDDEGPTPPEPVPEIIASSSQVATQTSLMAKKIEMPEDGWVTVHRDKNGQPDMTESIGTYNHFLEYEKGTYTDELIPIVDTLNPLQDGDKIWIVLHKDEGEIGTYEFNTSNGNTDKVFEVDGEIVAAPVEISAPYIFAREQVSGNRQIIVDSVRTGLDSWIVVHSVKPINSGFDFYFYEPGGVLTIPPGQTKNLIIELDSVEHYYPGQYDAGQSIYVALCREVQNPDKWNKEDRVESFNHLIYQEITIQP